MRRYSYAELLEEKKLLLAEQGRVFDEDDGPKPDLAVVDHQIKMVEFLMDTIAPPQYRHVGKDMQCL